MASNPKLGSATVSKDLYKDRRRAALSLDFAVVLDVLLKGMALNGDDDFVLFQLPPLSNYSF